MKAADGLMKRLTLLVCVLVAMLVSVGTAEGAVFEGGGKAPSEAPLITYGQHYVANFTSNSGEANYVSEHGEGYHYQVSLWRLPPLSTHDALTVNWHGLPFTSGETTGFPVRMYFFQGISDANWGETLEDPQTSYELSGSGTAQTELSVRNTDASSSYLVFIAHAGAAPNSQEIESYPYDFTVEPPRHYLSLALSPVSRIAPTGYIHASAVNAIGLPAPDGLIYTLTTTWSGGGIFVSSAASAGGQLTFPLALPESAYGQDAKFTVSRPADASYQAVTSPSLEALVAKPKNPAESAACRKASAEVQVLGRKHHRLQAHAQRARGRARHKLRHLAHRAGHEWNAAKDIAAADCT